MAFFFAIDPFTCTLGTKPLTQSAADGSYPSGLGFSVRVSYPHGESGVDSIMRHYHLHHPQQITADGSGVRLDIVDRPALET